jgi:hypothetical protein
VPSVIALLTQAQRRRLNRLFRIPGDIRLGDVVNSLIKQSVVSNIVGRGTNGTTAGLFVYRAQTDILIKAIKVVPEVDDVGGATTASHTWTFKKNNTGTAIGSLASTGTITAGTVTDIGAVAAASTTLAAGDRVTVDEIAGSTAAAMQRVQVVVEFEPLITSNIGDPIP